MTDTIGTPPTRETAADRRAMPSMLDVAVATAEKVGQCVRPIVRQRVDAVTGEMAYIGVDCGNTIESVCAPCAKKARKLRIEQCRVGWHLDHEPGKESKEPTEEQTALMTYRADLVIAYGEAKNDDDQDAIEELREEVRSVDELLRASGVRGKLSPLDPPPARPRTSRSTRRRQDVPDLPRRKVAKTTVGKVYAGRFQPSMFITLTMPSYGPINQDGATDDKGRVVSDGTPRHPGSYDYRRAARDIVHFAALYDRWVQNLRRAVGWDVQYFGTVEPQKRGAPHIHIGARGTIPRELIKLVTAATYHQVWWPNHNVIRYSGKNLPYWDSNATHSTYWDADQERNIERKGTFCDPATGKPLTAWDDALDAIATDPDADPAHVVTFGTQMDKKSIRGVLGGTEEAGRRIGYLTKYLTKSISEVLEAHTERQRAHYERLHAELQITPCSPKCAVWLRYGIVPKGATGKAQPGRCKGKAHRAETLGLPGRRVLNSRNWSGKTLPDHKADRGDFVRQMLAEVGIAKPAPEAGRYLWLKVPPGDPNCPPRAHLLMAGIAARKTWEAEYNIAKLAANGPPGGEETSAIRSTAA